MSHGVPVTAAMLTQFATLTPDEHVDAAVETLLRTSQGEFPVVDGQGRPLGVLMRNDLIRALKERGPERTGGRRHDASASRRVEQKSLPSTKRCGCCRKSQHPPLAWSMRPGGWSAW